MRRIGPVLAACMVAALAACEPAKVWKWDPASSIRRPDAARYPKAPAVTLLRDDRLAVYAPRGGGQSKYRVQRHEQTAILNEAGLKYTEVRVPIGIGSRLVLLHARTISPAGEVREVAQEEMHEDRVRSTDPLFDIPELTQRVRIFRFPEVRVGSVVEYISIVETVGHPLFYMRRMAGDLPVEKYRMEVLLSETIKYGFKVYNLPQEIPFSRGQQGEFARIAFALDDVPGEPGEDWLPPWIVRTPWWGFRTIAYDGTPVIDMSSDWPHALERVTDLLEWSNRWMFNGPNRIEIDGAECQGKPRCAVDRALALLRDKVELTEFADDPLETRTMKQVMESGTANSSEKSVLLYRLLANAGVKAHFAVARRWLGIWDDSFPSPQPFDHVLLQLPAQPGLSEPLWVDPSCEYCEAGQVPPWLQGVSVLLLGAERNFNRVIYGAKATPVDGTPGLGDQVRRTYKATLAETGDLEVTATEELRGADAMERRLETRGWPAERFRQEAERFVKERFGPGRLVDGGSPRCDRAAGRCTRTLRLVLPGYATRDGDQLIVPLTLLHTDWDDLFLDEKRRDDLYLGRAVTTAEVLSLALPPGWQVAELPVPERIAVPPITASLVFTALPNALTVTRLGQAQPGRFAREGYADVRLAMRTFAGYRQKVITLKRAAGAGTQPSSN